MQQHFDLKHICVCWQGFSEDLYAFFRDKDGNPLTARDPFGLPPYEG